MFDLWQHVHQSLIVFIIICIKQRDMSSNNKSSNGNKVKVDLISILKSIANSMLKELDEAIEAREKLAKQIEDEINDEILVSLKILKELGPPWRHGERTEYEWMRISLDKGLSAKRKERRDRLLQTWKELHELKQKQKELQEKKIGLLEF